MAISDRIKAEARRTIDGIQKYYDKFGEDVDDREEMEHRIARVEAAMEGCNGLSHDDKIQKTAENLFELTCAQERSFDSMRQEVIRTRRECKAEFEDIRSDTKAEFQAMRKELKDGIANLSKKIESSGSDSGYAPLRPGCVDTKEMRMLARTISEHPLMAFGTFIFILVLVFISGHFEAIGKLFGGW